MKETITPGFAIAVLAIFSIVLLVLEIQYVRLVDDVTDIFRKLKAHEEWSRTQDTEIDRLSVEVNTLIDANRVRAIKERRRPYSDTRTGGDK